MKYKLTGIDTPFGGISWDKDVTMEDRFKYLFIFLESKRILITPIEMEKKEWCIESVIEIKHTLTEVIRDCVCKDEDLSIVRNILNACNRYLDVVKPLNLPSIIFKNGDRWEDVKFDTAMKGFRSTFKKEIDSIEKQYKNLVFSKDIPYRF